MNYKKIVIFFMISFCFLFNCNAKALSTTNGTVSNGSEIYFNPETYQLCNKEEVNSDIGTKTGCMKWYIFNDSIDNDNFNAILDHNTTKNSYWCNSMGQSPTELLRQLKLDTATWKTKVSQKFNVTQSGYYTYALDYSDYTARIITASEINKITGKDNWNHMRYYFDTKTTEIPTSYNFGWLYDRTSSSCVNFGCLNNSTVTSAYWTSTASTNKDNAWKIVSGGQIVEGYTDESTAGIRPVIEISKKLFKYNISTNINNGTINVNSSELPGNIVFYSIDIDDGYKIDSIYVADSDGNELILQDNSFVMPKSDVTINIECTAISNNTEKTTINNGLSPTSNTNSANVINPRTSDNIFIYIMTLVLSITGLIIVIFIKKRRLKIN